MRVMPLITAVVVTAFLYFLVAERDSLLAFAQADTSAEAETEGAAAPVDESSLIKVVVLRSTERDIESAVILRGRTEAARQVDVRAETTGQIVSEPLRKGAFVNTGDLLCEIDIGTREASLAQVEAAKREAELNLTAAERLIGDGYASETRLLSAEAALSAAEAAVSAAQREIENTKIVAPFSGLLETDTAELGTYLSTGAACATIIQLDPIKLVGFVPEIEVGKVQVGAPAGARLAAGGDVMGRVTFLSRSADDTTRTFRVEVEVPNADMSISDGQTAEIIIGTDGRKAHLVPQSALTLNDNGDLGLRVIDETNTVHFAKVEVVRDTIDGVWVTGLETEANIITVGQEYVVEGVTVAPTFQEAKG